VSAPDHRTYEFAGLGEQALCFGLHSDRHILIVPPLFDEMNRVRRMLVQAMRALDALGCGTALPDLPGCNESTAALEQQDLAIWQRAVAAAAEQLGATHIASLRGGTLVDEGAARLPHWRLAPVNGQSLLKAMIRTRIAGAKEDGVTLTEAALMEKAQQGPIDVAGNRLSSAMVAGLTVAVPLDLANCTVRKLGEDIPGSTLWLRAEPQDDPAMADAIARDLDIWSRACAA
jgi:hypothetical protein